MNEFSFNKIVELLFKHSSMMLPHLYIHTHIYLFHYVIILFKLFHIEAMRHSITKFTFFLLFFV